MNIAKLAGEGTLVTGGSRGIGKGIAAACDHAGMRETRGWPIWQPV